MLPVPTPNPAMSMRMHTLTTPSTKTLYTTKKRTSLRRKTAEPDAKQPARIPRTQQSLLMYDIGKYAICKS